MAGRSGRCRLAADGRLGLVMVHGFMSEPEVWTPLQERVAADPSLEFVRTLAFPYETGLKRIHPLRVFPTLNAVADSLKEYLITEAGPFDNLMLVTHSMGGLVVQRCLARMLADGRGSELARIRRVVMLACPNNGSELVLSLRRGVFGRSTSRKAGFNRSMSKLSRLSASSSAISSTQPR